MIRWSAERLLVLASVLVALAVISTGCGDYGVAATGGTDTVSVALPQHLGGGEASLFLYRVTSATTGERMGVGRTFEMGEERQVRAVLQFKGIRPGTPLQLHFMWLNPDGDEIYTKEIFVRSRDWTDPAQRDSLEKAHVKVDEVHGIVEAESRFGISPAKLEEEIFKEEEKRSFKTGTWEVRTYLYRQRLLSTTFELVR